MSAVVTLKKGEGRTLKAGGLWVYDNEIASIAGTFENGDLVEIHDFDGFAMGRGFINLSSKIRIRLMTRKPGSMKILSVCGCRMRGIIVNVRWKQTAAD